MDAKDSQIIDESKGDEDTEYEIVMFRSTWKGNGRNG